MTLPQMIRDRHEKWKTRPAMMVRHEDGYREVSWADYYGRAMRTASALAAAGFAPGDRAAILSHTRYEWAVTDTAILSAAGISVPIYPSLTAAEVKKLLQRSRCRFLFASDPEQAQKILSVIEELPFVERVIFFDPAAAAGAAHPKFTSLDGFTAACPDRDPRIEERIAAGKSDDVATIIFTSGTTGEPKGVVLTHRNILSNVEAALSLYDIGPTDICLSHLPLAHVLERTAGYYLMLHSGCVIAYAVDLNSVAQNIAEVRPTVMISVPRIFEKIYAGIQVKAMASPAPVRALTFWAIGVANRVGKLRNESNPVPMHLALQYRVADKLVYHKVRVKFGGRLRFFVSGGAPLAPELAVFFNTIGVPIMEGYGLTETAPVISVNTFEHQRIGTVGRPMPGVEVRIAEDGEILVRGPNVFPGYFEDEAATREVFTPEGFLMTGDIGVLDADGFLRITDRKKDLIVTAGGKNVAPQKVENILKLDKYISEAMLYGDKKNFLTALIVPDFGWIERYAAYKGIPYADRSELMRDPRILDFLARRVAKAQADAELPSFETVKKFVALDHEFRAEEGEVTPTLKVRRKQIIQHYKGLLDALYEES